MAASLQKTAIRAMMVFTAFSVLMLLVHELHYTSVAEFEQQSSKIFNHMSHYIADHEPDVLKELEKAVFFHDDDDRGLNSHGDDEEEETSHHTASTADGGEESGMSWWSGWHMKASGGDIEEEASANNDDFDDDSVSMTSTIDGKPIDNLSKKSPSSHSKGHHTGTHSLSSAQSIFDDDSVSESPGPGYNAAVAAAEEGGGSSTRAAADDASSSGGGSSLFDRLSKLWSSDMDSRHDTVRGALDGSSSSSPHHRSSAGGDDRMQDDTVEKTEVTKNANGEVIKVTTPDGKEHLGNPKPPVASDSSTDHDYGKISGGSSTSTSGGGGSYSALGGGGSKKGARGDLICDGKSVDSEIIYWRNLPGDLEYESPITTHHGEHDDRYITYEYDQGGWNNVRMSMECMIVLAHTTGRTLVIPPQQHLYLLGATHKDKEDKKAHDEMGFQDFFDMDRLRSHKGFHMLSMEQFLAKEGVSGGLKGELPPANSTKAWGRKLWVYLDKVADAQPEWMGHYVVFPPPDEGKLDKSRRDARELAFGGGRSSVRYDEKLQEAHHIHFPADHHHRVLQHFYAWGFFPDPKMQSFYKRFVRDFMRYRDPIQCAGAQLLSYVRNEAFKINPESKGEFYALHVRRGDFQFKEVKIGASEIVTNLRFENGTSIIPRGAMVYLSTDDPDGVCKNCVAKRKPCTTFEKGSMPQGCPEDPSWKAFETEGGWHVRMLKDFTAKGALKGVNPNWFGILESIVCSRATAFAGTYFSTFTGYIHRLRGYHGLGESTYYHHKRFLFHPQMEKSVGHGFSREWRSGWTDDDRGGII